MTRSAAEFWWGIKPPKEVAYYIKGDFCTALSGISNDWRPCTYFEIRQIKIKVQKHNIERKRKFKKIKPCLIWVFFNNTDFFYGWYIYIKTINDDWGINFRPKNEKLVEEIMQLFPMSVLPLYENFDLWAERFCKSFMVKPKGNRRYFTGKRKQGLAKAWCNIDEFGNLVNVFIK